MSWFGRAWPMPEYRAPACEDDAEHVETPVGEACVECDEPIAENESGVMVGVLRFGSHLFKPYVAPIHKECMLRATVGPLAHLDKKCCCYGGDGGHDYGMTLRQESLAVYRRVHASLS